MDEEAVMEEDSSIILELVKISASSAIIFGGIFPFIPQYLTVKRTGSAEGFSLFVCFTLLMANILRILFWFGKRFELPLLIQSIVMVATMMVLVHACVNAASTKHKFSESPKRFRDFQPNNFWCWSDFESYVECVLVFSAAFGFLTLILTSVSTLYIEFIGFLAVFIEACLGLPQFYRNFKKRSTAGMSVAMVAMWTSGDLFKTIYFYLRSAPLQFFLCGVIQIIVDLAILLQIATYSTSNVVSTVPNFRGNSPSWHPREKQPSKGLV